MSEKEKFSKSPAKPKVQIKKPETTEDLVVLALERGGLEEVVRLLRDWCGSREIRNCLNKLHHRDPVDCSKLYDDGHSRPSFEGLAGFNYGP